MVLHDVLEKKGLATDGLNFAKFYVIETKIFIKLFGGRGSRKKRGRKMRPSFIKLLKTHVEKMTDFCLSTIFMKTKELNLCLHDVDENKDG